MTWLDIVVIGIIVVCAIISYNRGLIKTLFSFVSLIISVVVTMYLYPLVSQFLIKNTGVYVSIKSSIIGLLNLNNTTQNVNSTGEQINFINQLNLPEQFKHLLVTNNNSEVYNLLNVNSIGEYIGGLIATLIINILCFLGVFIIVTILVKLLINILDLVSKLPVLNQINKMGGLILGAVKGVIIVWVLFLVMSLMSANPNVNNVFETLKVSEVASVLYNNNLLMNIVTNIKRSII
ncbi:hypothetical protein SH1V18_43060 [Vallitalea longa]|uniref:Colicin V production protein n=1 Tax=Vallitalea longa TaxID=2936439 RepID=A0A9W5YFI9_9FIRM|nr:CvpA family protein [Vallitalea longa]GKX31826.1 hypothetical protein SH1V18_43060 [Vallitalea longa]